MLKIANNKIIPLYSDVITRFQALSSRYQVDYDKDIFYQREFLTKFFSWQKECLVNAEPTLELHMVSFNQLPKDILSQYNYQYFAVFVASMGPTVDELINQYASNGEVFKSYFIDSWFSEGVEVVNEQVDDQFGSNSTRSRRFSPGYGKIDITVNFQLANELKFSNVNVHSETGILTPRKSTICLIGFNDHSLFTERWNIYENLRNIFK